MNGDVEHSEEPPSIPRKIYLERGSDGYGFNLHGEKGVHGQFISAVDEASPAQTSDVQVGDRVIAVNDEDVEDLPHSKVVDMIRAGGNKVILLLVDRECDQFYKDIGVKIPQNKFELRGVAVNATAGETEEVANVVNGAADEAKEESADVVEPGLTNDVATEVEVTESGQGDVEKNEVEDDMEDANPYEEVIPKSSSEAVAANPVETAPNLANEEAPTTTAQDESFTAPDSTTSESDHIVPSPEPVADNKPDPQLDMAAARPKPKRNEVKRTTQNWKQKYEDFNKL